MKSIITHGDKVLFPKSKILKKEMIAYYNKISKQMLFHMKDRPVSLKRYPNGINKEGFFQKNISKYFPEWIKTTSVKREGKENIQMVLCNDVKTLLYLANQDTITFHIWLSKKDRPDYPDRLIFDIDPPKGSFAFAIEAAKELKDILEKELKLSCFFMLTGSRGLHLVVPIKREYTFDRTRAFAKKVASYLVSKDPKKYTIEQRKNKRRGRIFIDYMRNGFAQTVVAPFSLRAIEKAPIAMPVTWSELLKKTKDSQKYNISKVFKKDAWKNINQKAKSITASEKRIDSLIK